MWVHRINTLHCIQSSANYKPSTGTK
uniref:Uncharacterized protein n=1 Tax=Anguilla anguilla TaxID=7936 RepID=A0A0E9UFV2_ANGAN